MEEAYSTGGGRWKQGRYRQGVFYCLFVCHYFLIENASKSQQNWIFLFKTKGFSYLEKAGSQKTKETRDRARERARSFTATFCTLCYRISTQSWRCSVYYIDGESAERTRSGISDWSPCLANAAAAAAAKIMFGSLKHSFMHLKK